MPLTFTPQPEPAAGRIRLVVGGWSTAPTLYRSDLNGTHRVRADLTRAPIYDYEAALTGAVIYDASNVQLSDGTTANIYSTTALDAPGPWFHAVATPELSFKPRHLTTRYTASVETGATVHRPLQRRSPIIVSGPARTREGTFEVWCASHEEAQVAQAVLHGGDGLIMLREAGVHPGLDMFFVALRSSVEPAAQVRDGWRWLVRVDFVELDDPAATLRPARTFQTILDESSSFSALRAEDRTMAETLSGGFQ
ncbi:hypothetical protein ACOCJ5_10285 [Knoellia sp. CPCC 206450]|uniref:hypothetical protein n=1 Tax=Knoellia tibetensis TaxID=3404798 RepID=UPI003B428661